MPLHNGIYPFIENLNHLLLQVEFKLQAFVVNTFVCDLAILVAEFHADVIAVRADTGYRDGCRSAEWIEDEVAFLCV